jgi:hypothetical protein
MGADLQACAPSQHAVIAKGRTSGASRRHTVSVRFEPANRSRQHYLEVVNDNVNRDLICVARLFSRACANAPAPHLMRLRSAFRRLSETLLAGAMDDRGQQVSAALSELRRQRLMLDGDFSESRFRLDAGLVRLERDLKEGLHESIGTF